MDPLTVTASVLKITVSSVSAAKAFSTYVGRFKRAPETLASLCSETTLISASLSRIQTLLLQDVSATSTAFEHKPDVRDAFDLALTGCMLLFSCLEEDIRSITKGTNAATDASFASRFVTVWKENEMQERLQQLRGHQSALTCLISLLQLDSLAEIKHMLVDMYALLIRMAADAQSLLESHPTITAPSSIIEGRPFIDNTVESLNEDNASVISKHFEFDAVALRSRVYQRAPSMLTVPERDLVVSFSDLGDVSDIQTIGGRDTLSSFVSRAPTAISFCTEISRERLQDPSSSSSRVSTINPTYSLANLPSFPSLAIPVLEEIDRRVKAITAPEQSTPEERGNAPAEKLLNKTSPSTPPPRKTQIPKGSLRTSPRNPPTSPRTVTFSPRILFHDMWSNSEYDRRGEIATCNRLTPILARQIKEEMHTFKLEMVVHELSKPNTHFF